MLVSSFCTPCEVPAMDRPTSRPALSRLSANLGFLWPDRPLLARIEAAADAGFDAVEMHWPFDTPPATVAEICAARGLVLLGVNTPPGDRPGDFGLAALPGREGEFAEGFARTLDWARQAGASMIHVMAGVTPDEPATEAVLVANLRRAADLAGAFGITLLLEAINPRDRPGYFYSRVERAAGIIALADRPYLALMFDVYHVGVGQGDVLRRLERFLPLIGHVQIAAVPSRAEPDEGEIDHAEVLRHLDRLGYAGRVGCEYRPRGDTDAGLVWRNRLAARSADWREA
jgi:hydroxypyruvate isomerase